MNIGNVKTAESRPYVEIIEHPASKALRFRYECEGRLAGSIPGANSTFENKTFPTIRINNYNGHGVVFVSCVTKDYPHRPHPHSLVGKGTCSQGVCKVEFTPENPIVTFVNLGIQCVKKKDIFDALQTREDIRIDPFRTGFDHKRQPNSIDLNAVRLCFQVFIEGREGKKNVALQPVVSETIYDKKAMSDLIICKMSHYSATVDGGTEMVLLCEKVAKDNIQVRFFEKRDGHEVWEGLGEFKSIHVHKQVAIAFRTPMYKNRQINEPVPVYVQLRRPTDGVTSEPWPFQLLPSDNFDRDSLRRKRRKFEENPKAHLLRNLQAEAEKETAQLEKPLEDRFNPMKLEARVQSFPFDSTVSPSPVLSPMYNVGIVSYQSPGLNSCRIQQQQEHFNIHQLSSTHINYGQQRQTDQRSNLALLKLTPSQSAFDKNFNPEINNDAVAVGNGLMEIATNQSSSFDANLNQLNSEELAFFDAALSETLSSGLLINDA